MTQIGWNDAFDCALNVLESKSLALCIIISLSCTEANSVKLYLPFVLLMLQYLKKLCLTMKKGGN